MSEQQTPALSTEQKANLETARIAWGELQRHFAQGLLVIVDSKLDLVEIAAHFIDDNSEQIKALLENEKIRKAEKPKPTTPDNGINHRLYFGQ